MLKYINLPSFRKNFFGALIFRRDTVNLSRNKRKFDVLPKFHPPVKTFAQGFHLPKTYQRSSFSNR